MIFPFWTDPALLILMGAMIALCVVGLAVVAWMEGRE